MSQMQYFDELYAHNDDPWHYETRWYEQRKRDICLAILLQPTYQNAIELGCSNGVFSERLAPRCQSLLCLDGQPKAVELAAARLKNMPQVNVQQGLIPKDLPDASYDLIVISEILYYLTLAEIDPLVDWLKRNLAPGGTLLCCHWRYAIKGFNLTGESVHALLIQHLNFKRYVELTDADFLLHVWRNHSRSLADDEKLTD